MNDGLDTDHDLSTAAAPVAQSAAVPAPAESFSAALAALARPPKVGDMMAHDGAQVAIIGTQIRGPGDFSVIIEGGETLHSR